ncbi:MAG: hypothetical protein IJ361_07995 [Spirochaetaceae bacterium]|nr:hypothetical protein [Spirochaetaceae bacterium]
MTCDPGLGKAVDTQAPKVSIDYPEPKEVLKDSFTMTGDASDEVKVASCEVTFRNIKTGKIYKFPANVANDKFSVTINTPKPDGSFELPDGDYNVTVSVSDAYRNSTKDIVYTIDNTAPTVLITSPNAYVTSNWPEMYKTVTIKGEVYDATIITEVRAYVIDKTGKEMITEPIIADGTNTFNVTLESPSIADGEYYYYIVAKDDGGNVNTYCYHKYDIFDLLSNNIVGAEKNISFPSINDIGYVDQGIEDKLKENIDQIKLSSKKIENKKVNDGKSDLSKGNYPGFTYFAKDTAKVKWLNITEDGNAGIGIGSPVLGTIMPPTDGSAIQYDSVKVYLVKSEDSKEFAEFPTSENETSWADNKTKWIIDSSTVKAGEEGEEQVKLTAVGESLNFQIDSHPVDNINENWYSGYYKVRVSFSTSTLSSFADCIFTVTSGAPKLTEKNLSAVQPKLDQNQEQVDNPYASYYRGYMTGATKISGKNFLIGQSRTSDGSSNLPLSYTCLKTGEVEGKDGHIEVSSMINDEFKIEIPINAETHENDGEYTYTLESEVVTLSTVISRVVVVDTINPVITLNNLTNNKILDTRNFVITGDVEDTNGINKVEYQLFVDGKQILLDGSDANGWIEVVGQKATLSLELSNLEKNKNYTLKLRATDKAGNVSGDDDYKFDFTVNNDKPVIKIISIAPQITHEGKETVNGIVKVKASLSDTNSIVSAYYTCDSSLQDNVDWAASGKATAFNPQEIANGIEISVDTTKYTGNLPLRIKAIDEAENFAVTSVSPIINQELDRPIIAPSNFSELNNIEEAGMTVSGGVNVYTKTNPNMIFTVSDDDLVKGYFVKINEGNYKNTPEAEVNLSQKIMSYSVKDLDYGRHTLTFKIIDQNYKNDVETPNSFVEQKFYVAIDDGQPQLSLNNANNQFVGERFDISGKVLDENGIECIHLQAKESSGIYTSLVLGNGLNDDGTFSYEFPVPAVKESIVITAVDKIGNSSSVDFTYLVDTEKPNVQVTTKNLAVNSDSPLTRVEGYAFDSESSQSDKSGIDQVRLKVGSSITGINDEESILATGSIDNNGQLTWDATLDLSGLANGTHNIYVVAFDNAGNMSDEDIATVSIDADVPLITHSYTIDPQDYTTGDIGVKTESFIIEGFATDSSGIKSVTAKIQGQNDNLAGGYDKTTERWEFTVPTTNDGSLVIVVSAIDNCNKRSEDVSLTVKLDSKVPVVEFTNIDANGSSKQTGSAPYVTVSCSDETSGVKNFDYKFYYKPNNADDFVEYSDDNASGTIEFEEGTNSTNIRINMASRTSANGKGPFIDQLSETDGLWKLWYSVTDNADHVVEGWSPEFIVDRHNPTLKVNNVNELIKQGDALTVSGSVVDYYGGTVDYVTVSVVHNSYNSDDLANFKKTFTINDGLEWNPSEFVYNWTVTWDENNSPFKYPDNYEIVITAYDIAENQYEIKKAVSCDNTAPKINFIKPYSYSVDSDGIITVGTEVNSPIGNTTVTANIDDFKMSQIYYQIGGTTKVTKTNGKVTSVSVENGGIQDINEDGVSENPVPSLIGFWKRLSDANNGFTADIDTLKYFTEGKTKELLDSDVDNNNNIIQTLEIHLVAIDVAGNINYCAMPIKIDTDTDKPEVLVLSPKTVLEDSELVANVGGTTTLSGTVSDDNSVHSVWVNIELDGGNYVDGILKSRSDSSDIFSVDYSNVEYGVSNPQSITIDEENKTFTLPVDDANYFESKNKWYKVNLGENGKTTTTWNLMLNKDSEFDIAGNLQKYFATNVDLEETSLTIRVIALDEKADDEGSLAKTKLSDIKEFTLKIDSGSPSIIINNIDKIPVEGSYIGGNINYDLTFVDDGQITYWSVTAKGNKGEYEIASGSPMDNSHNETITLNTTEINDRCGNVITLKIYAEDNSKDASGQVENNKTSEETFKYTIDNSAPIASIAETIDGNPYLIATESVVGDTTGDHREIESRGNHLRIKTDEALLEGKISDEINGSGIDYVMLYFTKIENGTRYIYNAGINENNKTAITNKISLKDKNDEEQQIYFPLASFNEVSRNNNSHETTNYIIIDKAEGLLDNGSNGDRDGYDENIKANGEWMLSFDSTNLKDGVYDITYIVVDIAGNARFYTDSMFVQNHAPMVNSVVLATDVNADGSCVVDELNEDGESERFDTSDEISNTGFTVRNNILKIQVNVTGGTEPLKYFLKYRNSSNVEVTTNTSNDGYSTGIFTVTDFPQDGNATYTVWVEDSVEANLSLSSGTTEIGLILDNQDNVKPVTQLFELNTTTEESKNSNKSRGSLYTILDSGLNEIVQGHIEPRENSTYDNTDANDPDVSGTIILRGESYDDQRISSISLNLNGNIVSIASWENNKLVGKNGATIKDELGLSGHYVEWAYPWDTNSIASQNVNVSVITQDASTNKNEEKEYESSDNIPKTVENKFSNLNWGYSKMTVDVVPYITDIKRNGGYMTKRTRSGSYPLLRGEEGNTVIGFNLTAGTIKLTIASDKNGSTTLATMESIETSGSNITFTVPKTAKDGYLHLTVNNIPSVNNTNERNLDSNLEAKDSASKFWTDDRFIRIWQDTDRFGSNDTAKNIVYPAMSMDESGKLYASFTNYSKHNVYYTTIGGSSTEVFNGFDAPEETTILVTGSGKINVAYMGNYQSGGSSSNWTHIRNDAGGLHLYDPYLKELDTDKTDSVDDKIDGVTSYRKDFGYMTRFELLYHDQQFQQFKHFRLARKDTSNTGRIHTAYYDIDTMSIHYSNVSINNNVNGELLPIGDEYFEASWVNIDGGYDEHDYEVIDGTIGKKSKARYADEAKNITLGLENEAEVFDDNLNRTSATGEYVGIDLTNEKRFPVLVYFDSVNKVVKLAQANVENPKKAETNWTIQRVITDSSDPNYTTTNGNYVDMQIDSKGYVHVVFVNGRGELIYVKSTNNPNDGNSPYVFGKSVVIAENSPMNVDITVRGETPYIGYLTSLGSFDGLNTAFFDDTLDLNNDGITEGGWETMSAPLSHAVSNNRASVEAHPSPTTSSWESAHAYFSGGYYRAAYYIGNGKGH